MFDHYLWEAVTGAGLETCLKAISPIQEKYTPSPASAKVERADLPFYDTISLVRVDDTAWPSGTGPFWYLARQDFMTRLDGSSGPIHDANEADPIRLNDSNALEYLRFFCYFVHGDAGPFHIVETIQHAAFDQGKLDDATRKEIEGALRLATCKRNVDMKLDLFSDVDNFVASATALHGDVLFSVRFSITTTGMVAMVEDDPLLGDIPVTAA